MLESLGNLTTRCFQQVFQYRTKRPITPSVWFLRRLIRFAFNPESINVWQSSAYLPTRKVRFGVCCQILWC